MTEGDDRNAAAADEPALGELPPGMVVGGYRIEAVAGRGGMGIVYRATQLSLNRTVALKVIDPLLAGDPAFRRRFEDESAVAASLDHPNVVRSMRRLTRCERLGRSPGLRARWTPLTPRGWCTVTSSRPMCRWSGEQAGNTPF